MTDCPGLNVVMGHGWNEQQHCPGCAGDSLLREQLADAEQARHDSQELGVLAIDENARLRAQLADVTAQRDLQIRMCPAEEENTRLRAATQPLLEYLQDQGEFVRGQADMVAFEEKPLLQLVHRVFQALDAEKEKP